MSPPVCAACLCRTEDVSNCCVCVALDIHRGLLIHLPALGILLTSPESTAADDTIFEGACLLQLLQNAARHVDHTFVRVYV